MENGITKSNQEIYREVILARLLREGNAELLKDYEEFFEMAVAEIVSLSREVLDCATELRAKHRFRTPDAIHLAAAIIGGCSVFLTNDHRLEKISEITVEIV